MGEPGTLTRLCIACGLLRRPWPRTRPSPSRGLRRVRAFLVFWSQCMRGPLVDGRVYSAVVACRTIEAGSVLVHRLAVIAAMREICPATSVYCACKLYPLQGPSYDCPWCVCLWLPHHAITSS